MYRTIAIIIFAIGILLLVGGIMHLTPGTIQIGVVAAFCGGLLFGLSFIPRPAVAPGAPPPLSPAERITSVFYDPAPVFQNLRVYPRWVGAFLIIALCSSLYTVAFTQRLTPEAIASITADKVIDSGFIPQDKQAEFKQQQIDAAKSPVMRVSTVISQIAGIFVFMVIFAGLYMLGILMFGGRINFWQALAVAIYGSLPPIFLERLLSLVLLYVKAPDDIDPIKGQQGLVRDNLGILFNSADHPYLFVFGSFIGIITIYGLWLKATGLHNTGERVSKGAAWTIILILWGIGLLLGLASAALFPSFFK